MPLYINPARIQQAASSQAQAPNPSSLSPASPSTGPSGNSGLSVASPGLYRAGQAGVIAGNALDAGSTLADLNTGRFHETNPLLGNNPVQNMLGKGLLTAGSLYAMKKLKDAGHDKLAGALGLLSAAGPAAAGIHNLQIRNQQR